MHVGGVHNTYSAEGYDPGEPRIMVSLTLAHECGVPLPALIHAIVDSANESMEDLIDDHDPEYVNEVMENIVTAMADTFLTNEKGNE